MNEVTRRRRAKKDGSVCSSRAMVQLIGSADNPLHLLIPIVVFGRLLAETDGGWRRNVGGQMST